MEAAQTAFLVTIAIIGAVITPIVFLYLLGLIGKLLDAVLIAMQTKLDDVKKRPPFDEVEVNVSPATNVMTARFLKRGEIIWQGSSSRHEMVANNKLVFETEEPKQ